MRINACRKVSKYVWVMNCMTDCALIIDCCLNPGFGRVLYSLTLYVTLYIEQLQKRTKEKIRSSVNCAHVALWITCKDDKCFLCERPVGYECLHIIASAYIMMLT